MTLGIIGTAGRKEDGNKLTREHFKQMGLIGKQIIEQIKPTALVSGGAAWGDAVAVRLFLRGFVTKLTLHLPCKWDKKQISFKDSGEFNYQVNPGGTSNYYHRRFSKIVGINSLEDISKAIEMGAKVVVTEGFKERNSKVAEESDILLAMTFGSGAYIKDGGTADTARKFFAREGKVLGAYHYDLNSMTLHDDIILN